MPTIYENAQFFTQIFTKAAAEAEKHDKIQIEHNITEDMMFSYIKGAFPKMAEAKARAMAHSMFVKPSPESSPVDSDPAGC